MTKKNYKTLELDAKYIPKKNEEYMCDSHKAYFYRLLAAQRDELVASMDDVMSAINLGQKIDSAGSGDDADHSNFNIEADMQLRLHERNFNLLKKLDLAFERLEKGTFGFSVLSGEEIGIKRMMARPLATLTLEEQEEVEKKER